MLKIRRSTERGLSKFDWLESRHTFSFGDYYDPQHTGFSDLRVINEDRVAPGGGFPTHSHRDMEIVTYVLDGVLAHKDSTGTSSVIRAREVQRMSAGTGISHSEYNGSQTDPVHFLQIWIIPQQSGLQPGYEQRSLDLQRKSGNWLLVAAPDAREGALKLHQNAELWLGALARNGALRYTFRANRRGWLQIGRGRVTVNGAMLDAGDGAAINDAHVLELSAVEQSEILLFDLS